MASAKKMNRKKMKTSAGKVTEVMREKIEKAAEVKRELASKPELPCELAEQAARAMEKCCGMNTCDRMLFFEFLKAYGKATAEEQQYALNVACGYLNPSCSYLNPSCSYLNPSCSYLNIYGPDYVSVPLQKIMAKHNIGICELIKVKELEELHEILNEIKELPKEDKDALDMLWWKKKVFSNLP